MTYRPDIDGLRALAVLSVVVFHLGFTRAAGGFVGVDVFFVISGFLITSILIRGITGGRFVLRQFYFRRIRRLVPALAATVIATMGASAMLLIPYDMIALARSAVAALFSVSNLVFYAEAGYWDTASELKPLLHTWSLGVEEQFYLFWPALVMGLIALSRRIPMWLSFLLLSVAGLALCIWYTSVDQSAAFYLLPFRVFQFALGALIIPLIEFTRASPLSRSRPFTEFLFLGGLAAILGSVVGLDGDSAFPGWVVLIPSVGTAMLLLAGGLEAGRKGYHRRLLENGAAIWIGRVSYSMYLVHWPIVSLYRYHVDAELELGQQLLLAAATLIATIVLHYGIERRFYHRTSETAVRDRLSGSQFAGRTLAFVSLTAVISATAWLGDGWSWRVPNTPLTTAQIEQGKKDRLRPLSSACFVHHPPSHANCQPVPDRKILVLGNSHEPDGFNFARAALETRDGVQLVVFGTTNRCKDLTQTSEGFRTSDPQCQRRLDALFDPEFARSLDAVLYAANAPFSANKYRLLGMLQRLRELNPELQIAVLGGYINTRNECARYIVQLGSSDACAATEHVTYFEDKPEAQELFNEFMALEPLYIDRVDLLCRDRILHTCQTSTPDGIPAFYDSHHHSLEFSQYAGRLYTERHPSWFVDWLSREENPTGG